MNDMDHEESSLIIAYRAGDETAFTRLIERHTRAVYNLSLRILQDPARAEDVTQETFIKAWKHFDRFEFGRSFRTWILTIAHRSAIDHLRKKRAFPFSLLTTRGPGEDHEFADTLPSPDASPLDISILNEDTERLRQSLDHLSPSAREVLYLHYNEGLTFDEIGDVLGEPLNTVKSRHRRALLSLRALLQ